MPLPTNATDPNQEFLGTKGLVFIGDQVLVYRRDAKAPRYPLAIDVPGGGREGRESPAETFMREIKEEFGLGIAVDDISYSRRYRASDGSDNYGYYMVAKLSATRAKDIRFGDEGLEYMLMNIHDFLSRTDAWPAYQKRAHDYLETASA